MAILGWIVGGGVLLYFLINLAAAFFTLRPFRVPIYLSPGFMGFPQERVDIITEDGITLAGWWVPHPNPKGVLIGTHGYVMNRCEWVPLLPLLYNELQMSCLFVDHRGQGRSGKALCTFGRDEAMDVKSMKKFVLSRDSASPRIWLGSSMGAAAIVYAAAEDLALGEGFILDAPYRRLDEAGRGWWLMVGGKALNALLHFVLPFGSLMANFSPKSLSVEAKLPQLEGKPILLLYGTSDPLVPVESAKIVHQAAGARARIEFFEGAGHGHGRFREPERWHELVRVFIKERLEKDVNGASGG